MKHRQAILASARVKDAVLLKRRIHLVPANSTDIRVSAACGKKPGWRSAGWTGPEVTWPDLDGPGDVDCTKCRKMWHAGEVVFEQEPA